MTQYTDFKHPHMRDELLEYLRELSDIEIQKRLWLSDYESEGSHSQLDYSIHFLFDDTPLSSEPEKCLGWFLADQKEVSAISSVIASIEVILDKYGSDLTDAEYIAKPEWAKVLETSKLALDIIQQS